MAESSSPVSDPDYEEFKKFKKWKKESEDYEDVKRRILDQEKKLEDATKIIDEHYEEKIKQIEAEKKNELQKKAKEIEDKYADKCKKLEETYEKAYEKFMKELEKTSELKKKKFTEDQDKELADGLRKITGDLDPILLLGAVLKRSREMDKEFAFRLIHLATEIRLVWMNGLHALKEFMKTIADIVRNILSNVKDVIRHIVEKVNGSKETLLESFKVLLSFICTIHENGSDWIAHHWVLVAVVCILFLVVVILLLFGLCFFSGMIADGKHGILRH